MVLYWIVWTTVDAKAEVGNKTRKLLMLIPAFFVIKQGFKIFQDIIREQKKNPTAAQSAVSVAN